MAIVLSARFKRPLPVWIGAALALTLQMVIAVTAGRLLGLLPDRVVSIAVAVLFGVGAVLLWRTGDDDEAAAAAAEARDAELRGVAPTAWWRVSATVFGVVFLAEWGDLTQLGHGQPRLQGQRPVSVRRRHAGDGHRRRHRRHRRASAAARPPRAHPAQGGRGDLALLAVLAVGAAIRG